MGYAETLAAVREKYPQYADMPDADLGRALADRYPEYRDLAAPPATAPSNPIMAGWRTYIGAPASRVADVLTAPAVDVARLGQGEPLASVLRHQAPSTPGNTNPLSETLVGTPAAAATTAATLYGGALAAALGLPGKLSSAFSMGAPLAERVAPAIARVAGATAGAAGAGAASGEDPLSTGGRAGIGTAAGEGVGAGLSTLARMLPGAKGYINAGHAADIGTAIGEISPPLAGQRTTLGLNRVTAGEAGQEALSGSREQWVRQLEALTGNQPLNVPLLGGPVPLRTAQEALSKIGDIAFKENPLAETLGAFWGPRELFGHKIGTMAEARQLYGQVRDQIRTALDAAAPTTGPRASALFDTMQHEYAAGTALRDILQQRGMYQAQGTRMDLNIPMLQKALSQDPGFRETLQWKLGPDFPRFEQAVMRGAPQGADRAVQGTGEFGGPIMDWLAGRTPGAGISAAAPFRAFLPNMGARYIGTKPMALPPALQQVLDLAGQRATR